jgi:hypothetical protein
MDWDAQRKLISAPKSAGSPTTGKKESKKQSLLSPEAQAKINERLEFEKKLAPVVVPKGRGSGPVLKETLPGRRLGEHIHSLVTPLQDLTLALTLSDKPILRGIGHLAETHLDNALNAVHDGHQLLSGVDTQADGKQKYLEAAGHLSRALRELNHKDVAAYPNANTELPSLKTLEEGLRTANLLKPGETFGKMNIGGKMRDLNDDDVRGARKAAKQESRENPTFGTPTGTKAGLAERGVGRTTRAQRVARAEKALGKALPPLPSLRPAVDGKPLEGPFMKNGRYTLDPTEPANIAFNQANRLRRDMLNNPRAAVIASTVMGKASTERPRTRITDSNDLAPRIMSAKPESSPIAPVSPELPKPTGHVFTPAPAMGDKVFRPTRVDMPPTKGKKKGK